MPDLRVFSTLPRVFFRLTALTIAFAQLLGLFHANYGAADVDGHNEDTTAKDLQSPTGRAEIGGLHAVGSGYGQAVSNDPHQSPPDEPDPEKQSTPAGIVQDLEEEAEEVGASTEPSQEPG